jgi:hypothetical protein
MNASSSLFHPPRRPMNVLLQACGLDGPSASALRTPVHGAGLTGAMNRCADAVDAAYGIPLNATMPFAEKPRTLPAVVSTMLLWPDALTIRPSAGIDLPVCASRPAGASD